MRRRLRILVASTPVSPLGAGAGGGVELTLRNAAVGLQALGHDVEVIAPEGSVLAGVRVHGLPGRAQVPMQTLSRAHPLALPDDAVLSRMWRWVATEQHRFDCVINMAYDLLPLKQTASLSIPVAHWLSMGSLTDAMDRCIAKTMHVRPGSVAVHSFAQARTFGGMASGMRILGNGFDLRQYAFGPMHDGTLGFAGRIAPEKGLEDAIAIAAASCKPLHVWGLMQHSAYWDAVCASHPLAHVTYHGFLSTDAFQRGLGRCQALLMTPKWVEAFGNVAAEALACGVPVIAYDRGGPAEITVDGTTGFVVAADDVGAAVKAVERLPTIDRIACRRRAVAEYSITALALRIENWIGALVQP